MCTVILVKPDHLQLLCVLRPVLLALRRVEVVVVDKLLLVVGERVLEEEEAALLEEQVDVVSDVIEQ